MPSPNIKIICEDKAQRQFIEHFLRSFGVNDRRIYSDKAFSFSRTSSPKGSTGAGDARVVKEFAAEFRDFPKRNNKTNGCILIGMIDADKKTIHEKKRLISEEIGNAQWQNIDGVSLFVVKRNIETWIHFLNGNRINEDDDYKDPYRDMTRNREKITEFASSCRQQQPSAYEALPPSLAAACAEFEKIRVRL
jgi:hypothetical protein